MKNLITYLKTLWSWVADSQSTDVSLDRWLTVGSPSGLDAKWKQNPFMRFAVVFTLIFSIGVGNVWGTEYTYKSFTTSFVKGSTNGTSVSSQVKTDGTTKLSTISNSNDCFTTNPTTVSNTYYNSTGVGLRISKSSGAGSIKFTLTDALKDSTIYAIVVYASKVSGNTKATLVVTPTAPTGGYTTITNIANGTLKAYSGSYGGTNSYYKLDTIKVGGKKINTLQFGSASGGYTHLQVVEIITQTEKAAGCSNNVGVTKGTENHGEITTISSASVATCSSTESDRRVTITITPDDCYDAPSTLTWTKSSGTVSASKQSGPTDNGDGTYSYVYQFAQNDNGAGTFGVTCTAKAAGYTVNFDAGPGVSASSSLTETCSGSGVTLPAVTATGVCKGWTTFAGWATAPVTDSTTTSGVTLYAAGSTYVPASNNMTLYAVYSKVKGGGTTTLLSENFAGCSSGNNTSTSGSGTSWSRNDNFYSGSNTYQAGGAVKLGGSSSVGYLITKQLTAAIGDEITVSFKVKGWTTVEGNIQVEGNNSEFTKPSATTYTATMSGSFESKSVTVTLTKANPKIKIGTTSRRAFLDDLVITKGGSTTYYCSDPDCCTPLGTINGSVSWSNAATAVVSWDNLDHVSSWTVKYKTHAAGAYTTWAGDQSTAAGRRSVTITGLTPCTNYDFQIIANPVSGYCDKDQTIEDSQTHNWTVTSTGVTNATASPAIPSTTCSGFSTTISPATGYALPADITVTNASKSWNSSTGALSISSVTGNVAVTITPTCVPPVVTGNPADANYYIGDSPEALEVEATLASGTLTYLWKVSTNGGSTWSDATGTNNVATYSGASLSTASVGTIKFKCVVGNSEGGCSVESAVATITVSNASYFPNGKTIFIQAESTSAWTGGGCVKAWFHTGSGSETAQSTYWLFDATGGDAGKKLFAAVVPASGDLPYLDIQRFAANCSDWWNKNGGCSYSDANGSNTIRSTGKHDDGSDGDYIRWNASGVTIDLHGDPSGDEWASSLASFSDQGAGVWTATYNNYAPANAAGESQEFKAKTNYNGWIGNTGSNNNATLDGMHVGSTYNITATLDVTAHSLVMSKTFVKGEVSFDLQGHGSAISDLTNIAAGSKISAPSPAPNATGYTFGGWFTDAECTDEWTFASDEVNETMTLYAKWTANVYTITKTLTNVSNTGLPASFTYTGATTTALNSTFTVDATNFFLPSSIVVTMGGTPLTQGTDYTYNNSTGAFTFSAVITGNIVITATATAKLKSIAITTQPTTRKYFAGESFSSTGAVVTATMGDGSTKTVSATWTPPATPLAAGTGLTVTASYTEGGINMTATTTVDVYSVTVNKKNEDGDAIDVGGVTATWTVGTKALAAGVGSTKYAFKEWQVTGATAASTTSASTTLSNPTANVVVNAVFYKPRVVKWSVNGNDSYATGGPTTEVAYNGTISTVPTAPADNTLSCTNKFMGWSTKNAGTTPKTTSYYDDLFTNASGYTTNITAATTTFYAVFAEAETGVWTLDYSKETDLSNSTSWGSYGTAYDYTASDGGTWTVKAYKNAGMQINTTKDASIKIPDCSGDITSIEITCSAAKAVGLSASDYTGSGVTYIAYGTDATSQTIDCSGASATGGYIVPKSGSTSITKIVVNYGSTSNYVTQCDANIVRVTYDANGGSTTCENTTTDKTEDYTVCSSAPTKDYYSFAGWLCSADDEVYAANATIDDAVIDADFSLTAQWTPVTYNISYELDGGTNNVGNPATYNVTTATITLQDPTKGHDRFEGWYSTYSAGVYSDPVTEIPLGSHGDITLHAKWTTRHEIIFDADGATTTIYRADDEAMDASVAGQGSVPSDPSAPSTCSTKVFVGWSESEIDDETNTRPGDLMKPAEGKVDEDKHYYAVWALRAGSPAPATYAGTGTFVKITSMSEVETDTYYVLRGIDGSTVKVMKNTISSGKMGTADDPVSENVITNPGVAIVWKLGGKKDAYTLYNQSVSKYVEITGNSTGGYALNASLTSGATYTLTIEDGHGFFFKSNYSTANSRGISIYNASEFRSYGLANAKTLELYKLPAYTYSAYSTSCCETKVNLTHNSPEHGTVEFNKSRIGTCNSDKEVSLTITPDAGYKLTGWIVNTTSGYADAKTTSPAVVTNNNNSTVQNITLTFAQDANKDYNVTATFGLMSVESWTWTYNSAAMPNPLNLYIGQSARLDVAYTPAGVDNSKKTYTRTKVDAYINWVGVAQSTYTTISGRASTGENTTPVTFTHGDGPTTTVNVKVLPLPAVHFGDIVHNVEFADVVATLSDNTLSPTKTTPTHADFDGATKNTCEEQHLHLVGWIREDWPALVAYLEGGTQPSTSEITGAGNDGSGNAYFFAPGASINTETFNGVTFYAVWAKVE